MSSLKEEKEQLVAGWTKDCAERIGLLVAVPRNWEPQVPNLVELITLEISSVCAGGRCCVAVSVAEFFDPRPLLWRT